MTAKIVRSASGGESRIETLDQIENDPKRGFRHAGEFFIAVRQAGKQLTNPPDPRLRGAVAPGTFGNEGSGADGGFLVPPDFAQDVADLVDTEDSLLPFCDVSPVSGNSMVFPKDDTPMWSSQGVQAYWQVEAQAANQVKPALHGGALVLNKLLAFAPVTDELAADAETLGPYLTRRLGGAIRWKINDALLFGDGVGRPLGAFNSPAAVTIAKESGQATQTIVSNNLTKMLAHLPPGSFGRALWMINGDALPGFFAMGGVALSSIYAPGGKDLAPSLAGSIFGLIIGRPAIVSTHAATFSSQGDVLLVDMEYMRVIEKAAPIQVARSLHIFFDSDSQVFRATFRVDAQPRITGPLAAYNGADNLSPFVQLGAR